MSWGKLVDNLSPTQFDALVKVLSSQSTKRDFKNLLTLANLKEVFDLPKEFILLKVPHLNFEGSGGARAKERVLSPLLGLIKEVFEEMVGGDAGDAFPLPLLPRRALQARLKRPRELEAVDVAELRQRATP